MNFNIICTEDDKDFLKYKDKIKDRTVKFTIKQIFSDWWNSFLNNFSNLNIRNIVHKNVKKILQCKTFDLGYSEYECPTCHKNLIVPNTCKSRFCSSCGNKYNESRTISIFSKLFKHPHRHVVFTIPKELRNFFREDRNRINYIFDAASITIKYWFKEKYKKNKLTPAFISILHTYGRSLIWNPHIHMILLDGGVSKTGLIKVDFFSYSSFRKRFMKVLLDLLEKDIGKEQFRKIKNNLYLSKTNGFYVYAPKSKFKSYVELIKYVTRYVSRPVMAESRIIDYDGTYITFWYQRHEDDKIVIEKIHAYEFISRLIIHIPEPNFKYIRFYGAYCNTSKCHKSFLKLFNDKSIELKKFLNKWRNKIIVNFNVDPLICPICKTNMLYLKSNYF